MNKLRGTALLATGWVLLATAGTAYAGGFARGTADTDILFENGNFNMRAGVTYVAPNREFSRSANPTLVGTNYTQDYVIPSFAIKFNLSDNLRCAGTMVDNNGGAAKYASPHPVSGKLEEEFTTNEKALTCGLKFQAGPGNLWLLGGGFVEDFSYRRINFLDPALPVATLNLDGQDYGWRAGVAYEIPEIALRGQLMYRSGTSYGATGTLNVPEVAIGGGSLDYVPLDATGSGNLPQSVELKLQSGVAAGWLGFASVKWTDWSVQRQLVVNSAAGTIADLYNWKDGWTVSGGVGHAFNDRVSGLISLTWDQGVGTGYDLTSDIWTLVVGGQVKDALGGELHGGIGLSYLTSAQETRYFPGGVDQNSGVKAGFAVAANIGYGIKW